MTIAILMLRETNEGMSVSTHKYIIKQQVIDSTVSNTNKVFGNNAE